MHKTVAKTVLPAKRLRGDFTVPGDKSISHRAIMFASLAQGESRIRGLLRGEDCLSTLHAFQCLGITVAEKGEDDIIIQGRGLDGLREPDNVIDCGNSGTTMRLMSGILAAQPFFFHPHRGSISAQTSDGKGYRSVNGHGGRNSWPG